MMKRNSVLALLSLALVLGLGAPLRGGQHQGIIIQRDVTVLAAETQDNIFTIGGSAVVAAGGKVNQSVVAFGGTITIAGEVGKDVVGFGSRVVIKETAVVKGDVVAIGGTLEKEPGCSIQGDTVVVAGPEIGERIFGGSFLKGIFSLSLIPFLVVLKLIAFFLWLMIALLGAGLFPKPVERAGEELRRSFGVAFGIGFLAHIVFAGMIIFAALLSIILIGIPVLMALIAAGLAIKLFGRLVVFYFFGGSLLHALGSKKVTPMGAVLAGLGVVTLIGFVPIFGLLFGLVINMVGWGIAIRTKFGTTDNMFKGKTNVVPPAPGVPAPPSA
jgi:hypothetical protein